MCGTVPINPATPADRLSPLDGAQERWPGRRSFARPWPDADDVTDQVASSGPGEFGRGAGR